MEEVELYFRIKEGQLEIESIGIQIERLKLERDKISYEVDQLSKIYKENIESEIKISAEEVKPKKLKKTNDKPSENHIEV